MQHHGVPTRLLDWTQSLAVGVFFATRDPRNGADGAVWVMWPAFLTHKRAGEYHSHFFSRHHLLQPYRLREETWDVSQLNELPPVG